MVLILARGIVSTALTACIHTQATVVSLHAALNACMLERGKSHQVCERRFASRIEGERVRVSVELNQTLNLKKQSICI